MEEISTATFAIGMAIIGSHYKDYVAAVFAIIASVKFLFF